ncbi:microtubule-associated protein futsch-like [Colletes gigas]|uniref:microtubule-associated protein futsch-like n=1 Tax=Colletes gigas TaxID=935657 RepID=UPI001C9A81A2|nr:microtubule-associated protein futsch-like [Colletes gigas]
MPYYGEGLPYYYGGPYANHSSLMTSTPRVFHTTLSRFSPHLSTISESPLSTLRRYSPVSVPARPRRVIDTADIDVSTPRILSGDGNHQRNRLRRDRPTIKIRSQALKDNPALREHNERHEKSVGELLVEKFLIKDKKFDEAETRLLHQANLEKEDDEQEELQQAQKKIIRRFTRRRSSADIQLAPEQLEREVAYAQVQAKVLDTLVAEEQAEIENEVRRGTLIKKGAIGGPRSAAGFFRTDGESVSQGEEEATAHKMRKSLKKVKKKKRPTEKPSPLDDDENERECRSSTSSSDVSVDLQRDEKTDRRHSKPQMYKIEASNSVGDFSTVWIDSGTNLQSIEQFRESVKISVPRKLGFRKIERDSVEEESEMEVVLPVKRPYVKDTSRNSVHFTVRTPPETAKTDPMKKLQTVANGVIPRKMEDVDVISEKPEDDTQKASEKSKKEDTKEKVSEITNTNKTVSKYSKTQAAETPKSDKKESIAEKVPDSPKKEKAQRSLELTVPKKLGVWGRAEPRKKEAINEEAPDSAKAGKIVSKYPKVPAARGKNEPIDEESPKKEETQRRPEPSTAKKLGVWGREEPLARKTEASSATVAVDPLARETSASVALPSVADGLPKPSKINTDENNAVEAPKRSLRDTEYLANTTKIERDEDVGGPLPGKKANKAVTLVNASSSRDGYPSEEPAKGERRPESNVFGSVTSPTKLATQTTLSKVSKSDARKTNDTEATTTAGNVERKLKVRKTETNKADEKLETKVPWRNKASKLNAVAESGVHLDRSVSVDSRENKASVQKTFKQSVSADETSTSRMPLGKSTKSFESLNGESGTLSKSTSTESIDFWSEIRGPESPNMTKTAKGFNETGRPVEDPGGKEAEKKKQTDAKISVAALGLGNIPEEERRAEEESSASKVTLETETDATAPKKGPKRKKNLSIAIGEAQNDAYSTIKKAPLKHENSVPSTPDTAVFVSEASTPVFDVSVPIINIVMATTPVRTDTQALEDEEDPKTPTNEWSEAALSKLSKWSNQNDLSNVEEPDKDVTPVPSKDVTATCTPEGSPESSKKKKVVRKKKSSTTKKGSSGKEAGKESKESKKSSIKSAQDSLKPPEPKTLSKTSPKSTPTQRPIDLIRMFYTTPTALLTATPRDLSKVRRAKIKRRKHHSRTPSVSSDSTGSTTSTATTESTDGSRSTCTELDDDPDKRMNSTRSNDSGFDGSPRISTPSQSSDTQRNSDSSDHFPSGRITPPATNLPRFKKYAVTDFNFLKVLGKGSFGKVLLAELRGTECVYAVKCLKKDVVLEDDDVECTLIERKVLTLATRHPYLCHLFCTFQTDSHLFFVMEYLNGGDLMFHIQKSGRFSETRARFYAAEIWSGLNFLHKKGIVYRDLKLDNVLLDFEGHIRIADFGMCKLQIFLDRTADTFCGTPDYMAPEIIKGLKYNQAVDWWSYGVLLYEMLTGQSPFSGCDEDELFWSICNERPFIPRYLSQEATDMVVCLLEKDSGKRLPGHEIALHAFFQSLPWDRLERRQLEAPFKPALEHTLDTKYFDTAFTAERPRLTPVPDQILTSMDQGVFRGFSYTNPNATD